MKIKIFSDIKSHELATHWKRIVRKYSYFPQSSYGWCVPWWELRRGRRELHIVAVTDDLGAKIVGIAPFCIERYTVFSILRSFPIHFGDFFTFLIDREEGEDDIYKIILQHLQSFDKWSLIRIDQVSSSNTKLVQHLHNQQFSKKFLTDVIVANFSDKTYDTYIQSLSKNKRQLIRKKRRKFEKLYNIDLIAISQMEGYQKYHENMRTIYNSRWGKTLSDEYYKCRNQAIEACFADGTALLFILKAQEEPIAFFLGFTNGTIFYEWKISHHPKYNVHSPGTLIRAYAIEYLIDHEFTHLNFMAGGYDYKKSWAPNEKLSANYSYFLSNQSINGQILIFYYLYLRDKLKKLINNLPRNWPKKR